VAKPKRERIRTEAQVRRKLESEKRGSLEGEYRPFLLIHDFTSHGRVSRVKYRNREAHLMSDLETAMFQELLWHPDVVEIREQFPLDRADTLRIAKEMNVNHPKLQGDGGVLPITSDFVVDFRFGKDPENAPVVRRAVAVKPVSSLVRSAEGSRREGQTRATNTIDKLEIERRYWAERNCGWYLVTNAELCKTRKTNIELLLGTEDPPEDEEDVWVERLVQTFVETQSKPKAKIFELQPPFMRAGNVPVEVVTRAVRLLCKYRFLDFKMDRLFSTGMRSEQFKLGPTANLFFEGDTTSRVAEGSD
jgi:TnsA endonuclease N terminal.